MILTALMCAGIPPSPDNFKRLNKYRTPFYCGFESVANSVFAFETNFVYRSIQSYQTIIKDNKCFSYIAHLHTFISQSASSLKVIQKSTFVLSRYAPIRRGEGPVWASTLPDSFNNVMAVFKREISCLNLSRIIACICLQYNMDC